jgi:hypothetical protein
MNISLIRVFDNRRKEPVRRNAFQFLRLSVFCILLMKLSGCGLLNPTMPVEIPINLSKAGSVAEAEFWIPEDDVLEVIMRFNHEHNPSEHERMFKLVGREDIRGVLIPLKIQIFKQVAPDIDEIFYEKVHQSTGADFGGFGADNIAREYGAVKISKGNYRLRVEILKPIPEFSDTQVEFCLYYFRRK